MCDCSQFTGRARDLCDGVGHDGRPDPRPEAVASWRAANCSPRFRGLGDVVAAVTHATGIDRVVKAVTGGDCGCERRRAALNSAVPFQRAGE